jgi:hypothetical protein
MLLACGAELVKLLLDFFQLGHLRHGGRVAGWRGFDALGIFDDFEGAVVERSSADETFFFQPLDVCHDRGSAEAE